MKITVVDRIPYSADVTAAQALAYCRRVLRPEDGWQEHDRDALCCVVFERRCDCRYVDVYMREDFRDFARLLAETCEALARAGIVAQPSEALRAIAREVAGPGRAWWARGSAATRCDGWAADGDQCGLVALHRGDCLSPQGEP